MQVPMLILNRTLSIKQKADVAFIRLANPLIGEYDIFKAGNKPKKW